jgi:hypothetical protein
MISKLKNRYVTAAQRLSAAMVAPSEKHARTALFVAGVAILGAGLSQDLYAQAGGFVGGGGGGGLATTGQVNSQRIQLAVSAIMQYLEGSFGALIMAASGVGAIMAAAFGQYKAALSLMVVAVGSFILRNLINTFFNETGLTNDGV